jgi:CheY-like chemotaxis protein
MVCPRERRRSRGDPWRNTGRIISDADGNRPGRVERQQTDNRQIIRDMLAPTDYEITEAENGEEALAAIAKQRPDLILMDIQTADHGWLHSG